MRIAAVVADANVLLSAVVGKAALRVFTQFELTVHATRFNTREVERYLPKLASKYGLPQHLVELQWRLLPIEVHDRDDFRQQLAAARRSLAARDPDDAELLALALTLDLAIWSNDTDLQGHGPECLTTALLLRQLAGRP